LDNSEKYIEQGAIEKLQDAIYIQKANKELAEHLNDSLLWVLHYCKKHNIQLPNLEKIRNIIDKSIQLERKISHDQPTGNSDNNNLRGNSTKNSSIKNLKSCSFQFVFLKLDSHKRNTRNPAFL